MTRSGKRIFAIVFVAFLFSATASVWAQCDTYFKPGYRAVGKIERSAVTGRNYELADWTGDGRSDFWNILTTGLDQQRILRIYPALATGGWDWNSPINYTINITGIQFPSVQSPVIRDFDNDGRIDVLFTTQGSNRQLILLKNPGDGTLQPGTPSPDYPTTTDFARPIGFADVNSDGRIDRIYSQQNSSNFNEVISYSLLNPDGSFGAPVSVLAHTAENGVNNSAKSVGDFDGDGKLDIAFFGTTGQLRILKNLGNGSFTIGSGTASSATGTDVADLNNDGRADIVGRSSGQIVIYSGQADGTFTSSSYTARNGFNGIPNPRLTDLSGDGRIDLINVGTQDYETFINSAAGIFTTNYYPRRLRTDGSFPYQIEDFTGDGKADLIDLSHNVKNVFSEEVVAIEANTCDARGHTQGFNFDSTGAMDLVVWNGTSGEWRSSNGNWPSTGVLTTRSFTWGTAGDIPTPGDFDGDGQSDHAVYRPGEGNWYVYLSSTSSWFVFRFGLPGDIPVPNDFNGGGKTDFAVFRPSDGNWYFWYTETQSFLAFHWGSNGDLPVPADFDGDGKVDLAIFRPSSGDWYYVKSSDQTYGIFHWGANGDVPIPADYDGDGRADITVFRSGLWYILRSSDNTPRYFNYGTSGDIPLSHFELGEIAYPIVFRPSNTRWYHPKYFDGVVNTPQGNPVRSGLPNN